MLTSVTRVDQLREEIVDELTVFFSDRRSSAAAYGADFLRLWTVAGDNVLGGKLLRPLLLAQAYEALTPQDRAPGSAAHPVTAAGMAAAGTSPAVTIAAAIELLHYSFLLHDDVIDGDLVRRGRPNLIGALLAHASITEPHDGPGVCTIENPEQTYGATRLHWARAGGILMGDLLLASAHQVFARVELAHSVRLALLDRLEHAVTESVVGEQLDVGLAAGVVHPDVETILAMCSYKTATYSFELPLRAAAVMAHAEPALEDSLARAGALLGLAFQLQDDLLSTFGNPSEHGKDLYSDLREGKLTTIIAYAQTTTSWPEIRTTFGQPDLDAHQCRHLQELLRSCGAEAYVQQLVDQQLDAVEALLNRPGSPIPPAVAEVLSDLARRLDGRRS